MHHRLAVMLQKSFVDCETSPDFPSGRGRVDNDWIFCSGLTCLTASRQLPLKPPHWCHKWCHRYHVLSPEGAWESRGSSGSGVSRHCAPVYERVQLHACIRPHVSACSYTLLCAGEVLLPCDLHSRRANTANGFQSSCTVLNLCGEGVTYFVSD